MATATRAPKTPDPRDAVIYHPLERLRAIIRRYVVVEGVLSVLIFLVAWFTLALALDYGVFEAFGWDWVQDGAFGVRAAVLGVGVALLAGILIFRIVRRLTVEFSHRALALVLERRFPKVLGDRLITAVELADVEGQAKYGYSAAMIRKTIDEARERVGTVPVNEVFNWRRLRVMSLVFVLWVAFLVVFAFAANAIAAGGFDPNRAAWNGVHTAAILAERDVLLQDTPWPRRALLELQGVPEGGIRVARDGASPVVKVRAYRWVVADRSRADGWRPMMWPDVTESLVGVPVPELPAGPPAAGQSRPAVDLPDDRSTWTVDAILEDAAVRGQLSNAMGLDKYAELQMVFDRLEELAATPSSGRRLRKLEKPEEIYLRYVGLTTKSDAPGLPLKAEGKEYSVTVNGLKEDVLFSVRSRDYRTPERGITLVPPPALMNLLKVEYQPAYLHYASPRVPDPNNPGNLVVAGYSALKGLRQRMPEEKLSLTGDVTPIAVPVGTEVVLTGVTERPIASAYVIPQVGRIPGQKVTKDKDGVEQRSADPIDILSSTVEEKDGDKTIQRGTFTLEFKGEFRITGRVEVELVFKNADGIESRRKVQIQPTEDTAPVVEVIPEVIRRVGKEFWVTPKAKIPFNPESNLRDEGGLSKVSYTVSYESKDAFVVRSLRAANLARDLCVPLTRGGMGYATANDALRKFAQQLLSDDANARKEASFGLGRFNTLEGELDHKTLDHIRSLLDKPFAGGKLGRVDRLNLKTELRVDTTRRPNGSIQDVKWVVDGDFFDVGKLGLEAGAGDVQPRYELQLALEATDTNFDTGPRSTRHDPITLLVVSEGDLLVEIGKDEDKLGAKLDEALKKIEAARAKYEFVKSKVERPLPEELDAVKVRSRDALQDVAKARDTVAGVGREFRRIERECVYNQVKEQTIATHGGRANSVERVMGEFPQAVSPEEDEQLRAGRLAPLSTFPTVEKLMNAGQNAFEESRFADPTTVTNAAIELYKLEEELKKLRHAIGESQSKERLLGLIKSIRDNQERISFAIAKAKREQDEIATKPTPDLGTVGPVFLAKGETKKVRHTIKWRQDKEDELVVKVAASDPSIVVPAELKLDFEKNDLSFEYEVRSGTKEGEFTITLTPAAGDKIEVKVTVK